MTPLALVLKNGPNVPIKAHLVFAGTFTFGRSGAKEMYIQCTKQHGKKERSNQSHHCYLTGVGQGLLSNLAVGFQGGGLLESK
jgi:hypothetical protein